MGGKLPALGGPGQKRPNPWLHDMGMADALPDSPTSSSTGQPRSLCLLRKKVALGLLRRVDTSWRSLGCRLEEVGARDDVSSVV